MMIKLIGGAVIGIMAMILGGYIASLYFADDRSHGNSPVLIGIGVVLIAVGVFSFIKGYLAMRSDRNSGLDMLVVGSAGTSDSTGGIVGNNDKMLKEWNATNETKDKLKMLEAAGAAEEGS